MLVGDLAEPPFRILPLFALKRTLSQAQLELSKKVFGLEEAFDTVTLGAIRIELEDRGSPVSSESLTEALEVCGVVPDVDSRGKKIFRDESRYAFIRIHLGIQPSTAASHRCRAEIEKHGSLLRPRVFQHLIHIVTPLNFHELAR